MSEQVSTLVLAPLTVINADEVMVSPLLLGVSVSVAVPALVKITRGVLLALAGSLAPKLTDVGLNKAVAVLPDTAASVRVSSTGVPLLAVRITENDKGVPTVAELAALTVKDAPVDVLAPAHQASIAPLLPLMLIAGVLLLPK